MNRLSVRPVRRRKLYEEIVERLQDMMTSGELSPGEPLPAERDLTEMFGVGRTSVREALFALQRMGLIAIVTRPSAENLVHDLAGTARHILARPEGVREFQHVRTVLEASLARSAAEAATPEDLARLKQALELNRAAIGNAEAFARTDVAFHYLITQLSRNSILIAMHGAVSDWLAEQRLTSIQIKGSAEAAYQAHCAIFDAIAAGDPDQADRAMRAHLREVSDFYWQARTATV